MAPVPDEQEKTDGNVLKGVVGIKKGINHTKGSEKSENFFKKKF